MHTEQPKQTLIWNQRKIQCPRYDGPNTYMYEIPETFEGLAQKFVKFIPSGYIQVDIVADTHQQTSIKITERKKSW